MSKKKEEVKKECSLTKELEKGSIVLRQAVYVCKDGKQKVEVHCDLTHLNCRYTGRGDCVHSALEDAKKKLAPLNDERKKKKESKKAKAKS